MELLFVIYCVCNLMALLIMSIVCLSAAEGSFAKIFVYPYINENLFQINLAGKIIIHTLFTIAFLPALIAYYATVCVMFLACAICVVFAEVFKKKEK